MTSEYLTMAEIENRYPNEWVLIDRPKTGRDATDLLGGFVALHSSNRSEFDRESDKAESVTDCAVLYMGKNRNEDLFLR